MLEVGGQLPIDLELGVENPLVSFRMSETVENHCKQCSRGSGYKLEYRRYLWGPLRY